MRLPHAIGRHLRSMLMGQHAPCFLLLDGTGLVLQAWGSAEHYGYPPLVVGAPAAQTMPLLYGLPLGEALHLPFVATPSERVADLQVFPVEGATGVLLTDVTSEHNERQATQQQANEVRLMQHREHRLMEKLRQAHADLERSHRDTEALSKMKSRLIAGLSHEFRSPLISILGHAGLLHDRLSDDTRTGMELHAIRSSANHLLSLVDNILDQASIETGQMALHPGPTQLLELLDELDAMCRPLARAKDLGFSLERDPDLPAWIVVDATRMRQVIINLVTNAISYTPKGFVDLVVGWTDGMLTVSVRDSGPGIPPEARARIRLPFARGEGSRNQRGLGLGLAISAQLIGLMGGTLSIDERPGGGSVFGFRIPVKIADEPCLAREPQPPQRLLLVDDAPDIRVLYTRILEQRGYQVTAVTEQAAALAALAGTPDAIITDLCLDDEDGIELIRAVRTLGYTGPVVVWSASSLRETRERVIQAGADAYLVKPVPAPTLFATLQDLLVEPAALAPDPARAPKGIT